MTGPSRKTNGAKQQLRLTDEITSNSHVILGCQPGRIRRGVIGTIWSVQPEACLDEHRNE